MLIKNRMISEGWSQGQIQGEGGVSWVPMRDQENYLDMEVAQVQSCRKGSYESLLNQFWLWLVKDQGKKAGAFSLSTLRLALRCSHMAHFQVFKQW